MEGERVWGSWELRELGSRNDSRPMSYPPVLGGRVCLQREKFSAWGDVMA